MFVNVKNEKLPILVSLHWLGRLYTAVLPEPIHNNKNTTNTKNATKNQSTFWKNHCNGLFDESLGRLLKFRSYVQRGPQNLEKYSNFIWNYFVCSNKNGRFLFKFLLHLSRCSKQFHSFLCATKHQSIQTRL